MAKVKKLSGSQKVSFGKRRIGKAKKSFGPKEQKLKKYRGQGH